ncbi:zinc-ribbon domain-containing protein [bacterium]|nr:zinc-ribbon domain-containing protein [bacterium]
MNQVDPTFENWEEIRHSNAASCQNCGTELIENARFCDVCGYPTTGDEMDLKRYKWRSEKKEDLKGSIQKQVRVGRNVLFIVAGFNVVGAFTNFGMFSDYGMLISLLIIAACYVALARWSYKKPFAAILSGLVIYMLTQIYSGITFPETIVRGIVFKVVIVSALIRGVANARMISRKNMEAVGV